ncbi:MAG TPA: agglutinin biogenesis protein MshI [Burkholderiales bacterium]|jgi:MSHA biogenesis protein MshI|nr:agglutinin biogenesis protein MshI [Burkholderiales bacterium]
MKWFSRSKKEKGWLVMDESPEELKYLHAYAPSGARPSIDSWSTVKSDASAGTLERIAKEKGLDRYRRLALLRPGEYQIVMVDAPAVPAEEVKSAVRWSIKDMLDYPVEDATIDVLDIPPPEGAVARGHAMLAVAAKNETIEKRMKRFEGAGIALEVIDIPETAQRNIAALYQAPKRGTALLHLEQDSGLLTINYEAELYLARRMDIGIAQIAKHGAENRREVFERIQIELQRTFDHFDRQHAISVAKLVLGPEPEETGLEAFLRSNLDVTIERVDLAERVQVAAPGGLDARAQWQMFHLVGAALREEGRA